MPRKVTTGDVQKFKNMSYQDIKDLKAPKAKELLRSMRVALLQRAKTLGKPDPTQPTSEPDKGMWSPAYDKIREYYEKNPYKSNVSKMRKDSVEAELHRLNEFFNAKTSTVRGSRQVAYEQDMRLFGEGSFMGVPSGKPAQRLTRKQRDVMWAAYNEFIKGADTAALAAKYYNKRQDAAAMIVKSTKSKNLTKEEVMKRLEKTLRDLKDIEAGVDVEDADPVATILSGNGDDFY